jgi:autoinducer 2-degrading protein
MWGMSFLPEEENAMLKSIILIGVALALFVAACILPPVSIDQAFAQSAPLYINAVDIDVVQGQIGNYLAALKENAAASVHEPGCHAFNIAVSQNDKNHVFIFEVYDNAAALDAHRQTDHFKKYATTTKDMVAKRDPHQLSLVATYAKGM